MIVAAEDGVVASPPVAIGTEARLGLRGPGLSVVLERLGVDAPAPTPAAAAERVDDVDGLGENVRSKGDGGGLGELRDRGGVLAGVEDAEGGADIVDSRRVVRARE